MLTELLMVSIVLMLCTAALSAIWTVEKIVTMIIKRLLKIVRKRRKR